MRTGTPIGTVRPHFVLPDRSGLLERVDGEASGLERLGPMWRGHHGDHGRLADLQAADAVQQRETSGVGPATTQLGADLGEARHHLFGVRFVGQVFDASAPIGVITDRAAEQHDRTALRPDRPVVGSADREFRLAETEPVVTIERLIHAGSVATPTPRPAARGRRPHAALYDLVLVEPGPLPPHERSWRHPSELGPTRLDVDDSTRRSDLNLLALGGGTLAVLAVAALVVAMTPRTSSGPVALSATTTPITARAVVEPPATTAATAPATATATATATEPIAIRPVLTTSLVAFPHAVTPGPQLDVDGTEVADTTPDGDETVFVRTEAVTYQVTWDVAQHMHVPDGSVVFDDSGDLVARMSDGDLLSLVDG